MRDEQLESVTCFHSSEDSSWDLVGCDTV